MDDLRDIKAGVSLVDIVARDVKLVKDGDRWLGCCPFHNDEDASFNIFTAAKGNNRGGEKWQCFGCGEQGDVLDYVMQSRGVTFQDAVAILKGSHDPGLRSERANAPPPPDPYANVKPIVPAPRKAGVPKPNEKLEAWNPKRSRMSRLRPSMVFTYRNEAGIIGVVIRHEMRDGGKITPMLMYCDVDGKQMWCYRHFPEPRPLYGMQFIAAAPERQVIVVEGEKTADATRRLLGLPVVCWAGGTNSADLTDWSPLAGRRVVIVPDADEPGRRAADKVAFLALKSKAADVRVVDTAEMESVKKGWDLADAENEGWERQRVVAFLKKNARDWRPPATEPEAPPPTPGVTEGEPQPPAPPAGTADLPANVDWRSTIQFNAEGSPKAKSQHNVVLFLRFHQDLSDVFIYDEFAREVVVARCPPWDDEASFMPRRLRDEDVTFCQGRLERYDLSPSYDNTRKGIIAAASKNTRNPAKAYFHSLKWDGKKRLDTWLSVYLGATDSAYSRLVGRKWLIAGVRRIEEPGCKFDNMLILEGPQNLGKSRALRILATVNDVSYFCDDIRDIAEKETAMKMQGVIIVEIAELDAMSRAEVTAIKSWLSRQVDQYRPPYGATIQSAPRQCILAGTVNPEGGYLRDPTGNRRFWPVRCRKADLQALERDREQLWAEAAYYALAGERVYLEDDEIPLAEKQQAGRLDDDVWAARIDEFIRGKEFVTAFEILKAALFIDSGRMDAKQQQRVVRHLLMRKWQRKRMKIDNGEVYGYIPPTNNELPLEEPIDGRQS